MGFGESSVALDILLNAVDNTKEGVGGATERLGKLGSILGVVAKAASVTAGAAIALGGVAIHAFTEAGDAAHEMSMKFGLSAEQASLWVNAGKQIGVGTDTIMTGFQMLSRTMNNLDQQFLLTGKLTAAQTQTFKELGIKIMDAKGHLRPLNDVMLEVATAFQKMPDGAEKAGLAMKLFGRSGTDMIPMLNQGAAGLKTLMDNAKAFGVVVNEDDVAQTKDFHEALRELKMRGEGVAITLGRALIPLATFFANVIDTRVMPIVLRWAQWFAKEGGPRLEDFVGHLMVAGEIALPKIVKGGKDFLKSLEPLVQPLKDIGGQLLGMVPTVAKASGVFSAWSSASSQLPSLLSLILLALQIAAPLIKVAADNVDILVPLTYALVGAMAAWRALSMAQLVIGIAGAFMAMASAEGIAAAAGAVLGIAFGPITLVLIGIMALVALVALAWKYNWGDIQGKTHAAITFISGVVKTMAPIIKQWVIDPLAAAVGFIRSHWDQIKAIVGGAVGLISAVLRGDWGGALGYVTTFFKNIAGAIVNIFKGIHIPLPHFSLHGGFNPADWAQGKGLPSLSVAWYGKGGQGVAFGPTLIGIGERGPEAFRIEPLTPGGMRSDSNAQLRLDDTNKLLRESNRILAAQARILQAILDDPGSVTALAAARRFA